MGAKNRRTGCWPIAVLLAGACGVFCTPLRTQGEGAAQGGAAGSPTGTAGSSGAGENTSGVTGSDRLDCGPESPLPTSAPQIKPEEGPSCAGGLLCGDRSCCESRLVPGGTFPMGRSITGHDAVTSIDFEADYLIELPEHCTTVAPFYLDTFEVTVGRFLSFVNRYDPWRVSGFPMADQGANLAVKPDPVLRTGWRTQFHLGLPTGQTELLASISCSPDSLLQTWPSDGKVNEEQLRLPISCVSWYVAFAFCVWDGGRLPTEAEWEFAAAGGAENRLYPWGQQAPDCSLANFVNCIDPPRHLPAGTTSGDGRFGQKDLGGNVAEWVLDWKNDYPSIDGVALPCDNCMVSNGSVLHMDRGTPNPRGLRATSRDENVDTTSLPYMGFRCARSLP